MKTKFPQCNSLEKQSVTKNETEISTCHLTLCNRHSTKGVFCHDCVYSMHVFKENIVNCVFLLLIVFLNMPF